MKTSCETIKDLLPLYYDNVCSEESRVLVDEHIRECSLCAEQLNALSEEMNKPVNKTDEEKPIRAMKAMLKRVRILAFIAGSFAAIIVISAVTVYLVRLSDNISFEADFKYYLEGSGAGESEIGVLRPGKYYMNGDMDGLYYEVYDDSTMQLKGGEFSDLPEGDIFTLQDRERDFERFDYVAVSCNMRLGGHWVRLDYLDNFPWEFWSGKRYIYRDVTSIEDVRAEPQFVFAEIVNGGNAFIIWSHVFIRSE